MIMIEGGKDIKVQSYFLPAQRILRDIEPVEGEWEEVVPQVKKSGLYPGDREKILELYQDGMSRHQIEKEIFDYNGGQAFYIVKQVIDDYHEASI
jgi:hypothetical protein